MYWKVQVALFGLLVLTGCLAYEDEIEDGIVTEEVDDTPVDNTPYESPVASEGSFYFAENFDDIKEFEKKWVKSTANKEGADEDIAKYDGVWSVEAPQRVLLKGDLGLALKSKAKHAAIASRLVKPFVFSTKPLIVQYEVTMQDGQECGGSYIKLLSSGSETTDLKTFNDRTPYSIMFGPDKCGNDHKLHFIFRHTNPLNGSVEEKHCKKPRERIEEPFKDKQPHMYKLVLKPDNTFTVYLDSQIVNEGSLLSDFTPAVNPPSEIPDPKDAKPEDWDEREKIPDPEASKPDDWDENAPPQIPDSSAVKPDGWLDDEEEMIPDPDAVKPDDWDTDMDGEWEAPLIPNPVCKEAVGCGLWKAPFVTNPRYKGKWRAPYVANPNYKGKWSPKMVPNPGYFQDLEPFKMAPIAAVGIELWSMSQDILFDNILITDDEQEADEWTRITYLLKKRKIDKEAGTLWERTMRSINYKPGWWALYFVYCAIPVSIYVWYLLGRVREETVIGTLLRATSEHPWLWAIYLVAIALPCTLTLFFCCSSSSKEKDEQARIIAKKTDAASPDDDDTTHAPGGDGGQYESIHKGVGVETKVADSGSGDKEPEEDADEDTKDDEEEEEGQDTEEDEEKELIEIQEQPEAAGDVPRKRKTRKE